MTHLRIKPYPSQNRRWPDRGRVILAQYNAETVVVYQAYKPAIARYAVEHQHLGGSQFSLERMSWIKPSFFWMMHRSGWASKPGQERVLAIWLERTGFDDVLQQAVHTRFVQSVYETRNAWQTALESSDVRLQWDPDYPPVGPKLKRRAIQLGLRGDVLRRYAQEWITNIEDITDFVRQQARVRHEPDLLLVPEQRIYRVADDQLARNLTLYRTTPD